MDFRDAVEEFHAKVGRTCWLPILFFVGPDWPGSKYGGYPSVDRRSDWPSCDSCGIPLRFVLQLDLAELKNASLPSTGLIQLYLCFNEGCESISSGEFAVEPFEKGKALRYLSENPYRVCENMPAGIPVFESKGIMKWVSESDLPAYQDLEYLGVSYHHHFDDVGNVRAVDVMIESKTFERIKPDDFELLTEVNVRTDKLMGWPSWNQDVEVPRCPLCDELMEFIYQIRGSLHVDINFDNGAGYLFQCRRHHEVVGYLAQK